MYLGKINEQERQLHDSAFRLLADEVGSIEDDSPTRARQLAMAAYHNADSPPARRTVASAHWRMRSVVHARAGALTGRLSHMVANAYGSTVATLTEGSGTRTVSIWRSWTTGAFRLESVRLPLAAALVEGMALSDDGCVSAVGSTNEE